jgi:hypothetical protein
MNKIYFKLTILLLISIIPVASFNYFIDPYGIFNNSSLNLWYEPGHEPNQHYAKIRHLIDDEHSWDSYLFGSSRVGKINPDLIPNGNYYNMNYSEGVPGEHLADIRILLKEGVPVKNVMVGLDNSSYTISPEDHIGQIMRHPYDASDFKRMLFQIKYISSVPKIIIIQTMRHQDNEYAINFNILSDGMQNLERIDKKIQMNVEYHIKSERFLNTNSAQFEKEMEHKFLGIMEETIGDIAELIKLSKEYKFRLYFFINPTHYKYYAQGNPYYFLLFKKKLALITEYWDFSGFNSITSNNYYYYETSHYRTMVGDLIACRMTHCKDINVPDDFGVYITKDIISHHVRKQKNGLIDNGLFFEGEILQCINHE